MPRPALWLLLGALLAQDPTPSPGQQTTVDFGPVLVFEGSKVVAILQGASAEYNTKTLSGRIRDGRLTYYTDPVGSDEKSSRQVVIEFASGFADNRNKIYELSGGIVLTMDDGTQITTESVRLDHAKQTMICPQPVRLLHYAFRLPLTAEAFWGGPTPDAELSGDALEVDNAARTFTVTANATLILGGPMESYLPGRKPAPPAPAQVMELRSAGPMELKDYAREIPGDWRILRVQARGDVRVRRADANGSLAVRSEHATFYVARPRTGSSGGTLPLAASMRGSVALEDSRGFQASCATFDWNHRDDLMRLEGGPQVLLRQSDHVLRANRVCIDRWRRLVTFEGDISATLKPAADQPPMDLVSTDLELECFESGRTWKPLELRGDRGVKLTGALAAAGGAPIRAEAEAFAWNAVENRSTLRGAPRAVVLQGENLAVAPLIVFEGGPDGKGQVMHLHGPKLLRFVQVGDLERRAALADAVLGLGALREEPGREAATTRVNITGDGGLQYDAAAGRVRLSDRHRVRTGDSSLEADVLHLQLSGDGTGVESILGYGRVRLARVGGASSAPVQLSGEAMQYRPAAQLVEMHGLTRAVMQLGGLGEIQGKAVRFHLETQEAEVIGDSGTGRLLMDRGGKP